MTPEIIIFRVIVFGALGLLLRAWWRKPDRTGALPAFKRGWSMGDHRDRWR